MPVFCILAYFLVETLAFWGVCVWIGTGWALAALFITMLCGMSIALWEVRRLMSQQVISDGHGGLYVKRQGVGKLAGNVGLTLAGGLLLSAPGFVSCVVGLFLIIAPTRAIVRRAVGVRIFRSVEKAGLRFYERANMGQPRENYGSFAAGVGDERGSDSVPQDEIINEAELRRWSDSLDPDDFKKDN